MSTPSSPPARRNSSKPFIDPSHQQAILKQKAMSHEANIPNVMTSPASFPVDYKPGSFGNFDLKDIEEDSSFSASSVTDIPKPPDGGWGWFVVFASFMIHVLADGITYTLGIYVVELKKAFQEGSGSVSFIPSILVGITLGSGPIASMLVNRYGCRVVTIAGAVLSAFGLAISAAANSLVLLYLSIGVCTGLGFGLIYLPAIVSVSMYFEKKRAFATGIAVCGSGLGTFIWAPLTQFLIDSFGWKGAFLVTGAIVLLNIFFGAFFRPLPVTSIDSASTAETQNYPEIMEEQEALTKASKNNSFCTGENGTLTPEIKVNGEPLKPFSLLHHDSGKYSQMARMALSHPVLPIQPPMPKPQEQYGSHSRIYDRSQSQNNPAAKMLNSRRGSRVMLRKDIFYTGSLYNIPEYKNNPRRYSRYHIKLSENNERAKSVTKETMSNEKIDLTSNEAKQIIAADEEDAVICGCIPVSAEAAKGFKQMINVGLLKDTIFIMFVVSNFLTSIGFNVPYVYTVDRAVNLGIDEVDASYLLSVVGIANTLGRIILGYISDRSWINRLYLYNTSLAICGISMALSNFWHSYTAQAIFCAVFGITSGAYVGLTSVVLVDLLGLDNLTNAFGLLLLFQGIASVIGPPFIGWLYDQLGNYQSGFYFSGAMIFISGVMLFVLPRMQRSRDKHLQDLEARAHDHEFPKIVEEDEERFDPDDNPQMTMEARS